jgi:hypothetical protein
MTEIIDFGHIHVGGEWPTVLDIVPIEGHADLGICAQFFILPRKGHRVELRCKGIHYALFLFGYQEQELPELWQDSELVWSLGEQSQ